MTFSVEYSSAEEIIIASIRGEAGTAEFKEVLVAIILLAKQKACFHILTDLREAEIDMSMAQIFFLPNTITEIARAYGVELWRYKRAFVSNSQSELSGFYETVSRNRRHKVTLFYDIEKAKEWLKEGGAAK